MEEEIDILDRDCFVDYLIETLKCYTNEKNVLAIDGEWGVGKTFVLNRLEEKCRQGGYLTFKYNCWENDFYEEPLIGILSSILDQLNTLFKSRNNLIAIEKEVRDRITESLLEAIKKIKITVFGFDIGSLVSSIYDFINAVKDKQESLKYDLTFDTSASLKIGLESARGALKELSNNHKVIIFVDEIDRCIPTYQIKVLERLHHLFSGGERISVVFALNGVQLKETVSHVFGNVDYQRYIEKFFSQRIELKSNRFNKRWMEKYKSYFEDFSINNKDIEFLNEFIPQVFEKINIRTCNSIFHKLALIHSKHHDEFVNLTDRSISILCMEIILILLKDAFNGIIVEGSFRGGRRDGKMELVFYSRNKIPSPAFNNFNTYVTGKLNGVDVRPMRITHKNYQLYTIFGDSKKDFDTWADIYIYMLHLKKLFSSEMEGGYVFEKEVLNGYRGEFDWLDIFVDENELLESSKMKP